MCFPRNTPPGENENPRPWFRKENPTRIAPSGAPWYRLLDTTRAYALEKLAANGEFEQMARRHLQYYRDLFERIETEWETRRTVKWRPDHNRQIDDARAALAWAFGPGGDAATGVALAAASVPLWLEMSLVSECRRWVEHALASCVNSTVSGSGVSTPAKPGGSLTFLFPARPFAYATIFAVGGAPSPVLPSVP